MQKVGDYYASCMDENGINAKGLGALQIVLDRVQALTNTRDLGAEIGRLHRVGLNVLFNFGSGQDFN